MQVLFSDLSLFCGVIKIKQVKVSNSNGYLAEVHTGTLSGPHLFVFPSVKDKSK